MKKLLAFVAALFTGIFATGLAMAAEGAAAGADSKGAAIAIAAGIAVAIAAFGAAFGQGRVGAAAMESIGRNPNAADRLFLPLVLTLALLEALALYGFVIAIILSGKIYTQEEYDSAVQPPSATADGNHRRVVPCQTGEPIQPANAYETESGNFRAGLARCCNRYLSSGSGTSRTSGPRTIETAVGLGVARR